MKNSELKFELHFKNLILRPCLKKIFLAALLALLGLQSNAQANENDSLKKLDKKAKYRLYPGGKDEEDLKVQSQLPGPGKRMNIETKSTQESD